MLVSVHLAGIGMNRSWESGTRDPGPVRSCVWLELGFNEGCQVERSRKNQSGGEGRGMEVQREAETQVQELV